MAGPFGGGGNVATITARLEAVTRDFDQRIKRSEEQLERLNKTSGRTSSSVKSLDRALSAASGGAVLIMGKQLLNLAVRAEAWGRRYETVFQGVTSEMDKWIKAQGTAFGVSERHLKGMAAAMQDLLVPMGFARNEAMRMTQQTLELSNALSEWVGGTRSAEEVTEIIVRALVGEREALKGLGVAVLESDVAARLAAKGQDELTGAAREQAKALVTLEIITEKSADALTAYRSGGGEAARTMKEFDAQMEELKITLGETLASALPLLDALGEFAKLSGTTIKFVVDIIPGDLEGLIVAQALGGFFGKKVATAFGASAATAAQVGLTVSGGATLIAANAEAKKGIDAFYDYVEELHLRHLAEKRAKIFLAQQRAGGIGAAPSMFAVESAANRRQQIDAAKAEVERFLAARAVFLESMTPLARGIESPLSNLEFALNTAQGPAATLNQILFNAKVNAQGIVSALLATTDPVFAALQAAQNLAQIDKDIVDRKGDGGKIITDLEKLMRGQAFLQFAAAMESLASLVGPQAAIEAMAIAMGVSATEAERILEAMGILSGKQWVVPVVYTISVQGNEPIMGTSGSFRFGGPTEARAAGGPVSAGTPYMVGERGPEMFVPSRSGTIIPNGPGGVSVVVNVGGSVVSERDLVEHIRRSLRAGTIRGGGQQFD